MNPPPASAKLSSTRRISRIWALPVIALLLGAWMFVHTFLNQGPEIEIRFLTADGIVAGKTKIKSRSVDIGTVESVELSQDSREVVIKGRLSQGSARLLRADSQFWVVRPRIGADGISGIGTLLSGTYIELSPGSGAAGQRIYVGLDRPPLTAHSAPGKFVTLLAEEAGSVSAGDPVLYRGFRVGTVGSGEFQANRKSFVYKAFVEAPYHNLLSTASRFWNYGGVSIGVSASGLSVRAGSMESIISGGVAFDLPKDVRPGDPISENHEFILHADQASIDKSPYLYSSEYVLLFNDSVRGLEPGAPVEYRGVQVGSVVDISFNYLPGGGALAQDRIPIPVLIRVDPGQLRWEDSAESKQNLEREMLRWVRAGLRASLQTGSLLTGKLYVSFDYVENAEPTEVTTIGDYAILPTYSRGLQQIESKVIEVLDLVASLPLKAIVEKSEDTLMRLDTTLENAADSFTQLDAILKKESLQKIPDSLEETLAQVRQTMAGIGPNSPFYKDLGQAMERLDVTLKGLEELTADIKRKPSSLIFSRPAKPDPEPKASGRKGGNQ